ncbi:MAG: sigma-54 interaction domain-containing protein [Candidatus Scatomorpha sp.]|jgi:transcriptional regulator with PAS, ATPase and Fis domain
MLELFNHEAYNNNEILSLKRRFINEGEVSNKIRPFIIQSWKRSFRYGVRSEQSVFSESFYNMNTDDKTYYEDRETARSITSKYVNQMYRFVDASKGVFFAVSRDLVVLNINGNKELINHLHSINLRIGQSMSESNIGTNAAALAKETGADVFVYGAEHYTEALHDFAACARPFYTSHSKLIGYCMIITKTEDFNLLFQAALFFMQSTFSTNISLRGEQVEKNILYELLKWSVAKRNHGLILLNNINTILSINDEVEKIFGVKSKEVVGKRILHVPQFSELSDILLSPKSFQEIELTANEKPAWYFVDIQKIYNDEENIGTIVKLDNSSEFRKRMPGQKAHFTFSDLLGESLVFKLAKEQAKNIAASNSNVVIIGESGTGKELFAQSIHNESRRKNEPFLSINCAAIPRELIGNELFGYVEGAFAGAKKGGAPGKFELADKGTLFLDEISEMPLDMQSALLRVLEERSVTRIGGKSAIPVDVRILAATKQNLFQLVSDGRFRADLYYRLNVIQIFIPPLRERREDIALIANHFIEVFSKTFDKKFQKIDPAIYQRLSECRWPGNVRELRNVIERTIVSIQGTELSLTDLVFDIDHSQENLTAVVESDERAALIALLKKHKGNKTKAAKELGVTRATLYNRLNRNGIF